MSRDQSSLHEFKVKCTPQGILKNMGGPAAGVFLQYVPEDDAILSLRTWLEDAARFYEAASNLDLREGWELFLRWPATLGDEPAEGPCLMGLNMCLIDPAAEYSGDSCLCPADWARISQALGWMPACELSIWVGCNRPRDHKVLGWLCAELATRFDGMIDLGGMLPLPKPPVQPGSLGLPGRVVETSYDLDEGRTASLHIVDAEFLRFWMRQPQFHMIK